MSLIRPTSRPPISALNMTKIALEIPYRLNKRSQANRPQSSIQVRIVLAYRHAHIISAIRHSDHHHTLQDREVSSGLERSASQHEADRNNQSEHAWLARTMDSDRSPSVIRSDMTRYIAETSKETSAIDSSPNQAESEAVHRAQAPEQMAVPMLLTLETETAAEKICNVLTISIDERGGFMFHVHCDSVTISAFTVRLQQVEELAVRHETVGWIQCRPLPYTFLNENIFTEQISPDNKRSEKALANSTSDSPVSESSQIRSDPPPHQPQTQWLHSLLSKFSDDPSRSSGRRRMPYLPCNRQMTCYWPPC